MTIPNRKIEVEDLPRYSIADWELWKGKWELIEGIPYAMSPMPGKKHQRLNGKLYSLFSEMLDDCSDCEAFLPVNYKINQTNLLHPDLLVVCGEEEEGVYVTNTPHLVLEILSSSTQKKDKETKPKIYKALGIRYYVIIDPKKELIFIYELNGTVEYELKAKGKNEIYAFDFDECKVKIDFSEIWKRKKGSRIR